MMKQIVRNEANALQQKAWNLYNDLQAAIREQAKLFLVIGKILKTIRDEKFYRQLGEGGFDTFEQFINNPEIGLRYSTAYLYIRIYEYYVEQLQLLEEQIIKIPLNRLMRLLPILKEKEESEAKEIVEQAAAVTNYDFDQVLKERNIEFAKRPRVYICKICGKWRVEIDPEDLCTCKRELKSE